MTRESQLLDKPLQEIIDGKNLARIGFNKIRTELLDGSVHRPPRHRDRP
jgi:hypothetical protein